MNNDRRKTLKRLYRQQRKMRMPDGNPKSVNEITKAVNKIYHIYKTGKLEALCMLLDLLNDPHPPIRLAAYQLLKPHQQESKRILEGYRTLTIPVNGHGSFIEIGIKVSHFEMREENAAFLAAITPEEAYSLQAC